MFMDVTDRKFRKTVPNLDNNKLLFQRVHRIGSGVPFKAKCVVLYYAFYNKIIHKGILRKAENWAEIVGSYAENTCTGSSDIDFMVDIGNVYTEPPDIPLNVKNGILVITDLEGIPPGSCWLRLYMTTRGDRYRDPLANLNGLEWFFNCGEHINESYSVCIAREIDGHTHIPNVTCLTPAFIQNQDGYYYISKAKLDKYYAQHGLTVFKGFNKLLPKWLTHGPAFTQKYFGIFDVDVVNTFVCTSGWPASAAEWIHRKRNWPDDKTVQIVISSGFHVVPIASKLILTAKPDFEWRISFRAAETRLVKSFNECQRTCFIILKILIKEYIGKKFPDEDFVSSYTMKTLMFWNIEETNASVWQQDNLTGCLQLCLDRFRNWLEEGFCPNYFIRDYDLFRTKIQRMFILGFREWLSSELDKYGWKIILKCPTFAKIPIV